MSNPYSKLLNKEKLKHDYTRALHDLAVLVCVTELSEEVQGEVATTQRVKVVMKDLIDEVHSVARVPKYVASSAEKYLLPQPVVPEPSSPSGLDDQPLPL